MISKTPDAPATDKQIEYIKSMIYDHGKEYRTRMRSLTTLGGGPFTDEDATGLRRHSYREYQANELLAELWGQVKIPTTMSQKRASGMIDRLKKNGGTIVDTWLDDEKVAAAYGVLEFINANRERIEKALNSL